MPFGDGNGKICKVQKCKSTGKPCTNKAVNGYDVCGVHGGRTPRGIASANTIHGRYSADLPTRLAARFENAINDAELGTLKSELALLDTRIGEMLSRIDNEQYSSLWVEVGRARDSMNRAMASGNGQQLIDAFNHLDDVANTALNENDTWDRIVVLIEQRRKLTDSERKRMVDLNQMITAEQSMLLVTTLMRAVKTHVTDPTALSAIADEIRTVTG